MENNNYLKFSELAKNAAVSGVLRKLTLSKPSSSAEYVKVTVTLFEGDTGIMIAFEGALSDGRVIRKNYSADALSSLLLSFKGQYSQANLLTT